jgi:hypothetical protein
MNNLQSLTIGAVLIVILIVLFFRWRWNASHSRSNDSNSRENYGGPVKKIQRIPLSTCYGLCQQYYDGCMAQYQYIDADDCERRYKSCLNVCRYSDYQRM